MLKTLLILLTVYWTGACTLQRKLIFPAGMANSRLDPALEPGAGIPRLERLELATDAGKTEYWLSLAPGASAESPSGLVIFAHGNAELIDGQAWAVAGMHKLGYSVAMCEFRGYGRSDGSPTQADITKDHKAMLEELQLRPELDTSELIYFGRSVGTGVVCSLANEISPTAIILISPFESVKRLAWRYFIPSLFVLDPFDSKSTLESFEGPALLMHGKDDTIIPYEHSEALHEADPESQLEAFDCGHNDFPATSKRTWKLIDTFLRGAREEG